MPDKDITFLVELASAEYKKQEHEMEKMKGRMKKGRR